MNPSPIRLMKDRRYQLLAVGEIVVLNSRGREQERFGENVKSIGNVGLLKPVLVNERFREKTGKYELVCGEGRLLAHRELGKPEIAAEIVDCTRKQAYLLSLIENIARVPPETMWFAREVKRLHDSGMSPEDLSRIVGKSEAEIAGYLNLVEKGEERLLRGVERGVFPITFALQVSKSGQAETQNLLMDAFGQGLVTSANLRPVRRIIESRATSPASPVPEEKPGPPAPAVPGPAQALPGEALPPEKEEKYTVEELKRDIVRTTREKTSFVRETSLKEGQLVLLLEGLKELRSSKEFMDLLEKEGLAGMPTLQGSYGLVEKETVTSHG